MRNVKSFNQALPFIVAGVTSPAKSIPTLVCPPGAGKSAFIKGTLFPTLQANHGFDELIVLTTSSLEGIDFVGVPDLNTREYALMGAINKIFDTDKRTLVFLDEIGQADFSVQKALQRFFDGELAGRKIGDNVSFVAASNDVGQGADVEVLTPLVGRLSIINIQPRFDDWLTNYASQYSKLLHGLMLQTLIGQHQEVLRTGEPEEGFTKVPTLRGITEAMIVAKVMEEQMGEPLTASQIGDVVTQNCGAKYAGSFRNHMNMVNTMPLSEALDNQHQYGADKALMQYHMLLALNKSPRTIQRMVQLLAIQADNVGLGGKLDALTMFLAMAPKKVTTLRNPEIGYNGLDIFNDMQTEEAIITKRIKKLLGR